MLTEFSSTDCDELSESLANTDQVFRQLEPGPFQGRWRLLELPGASIVEDQITHGIYNSAAVSSGFLVVFIPIRQRGTVTIDGHSHDSPGISLALPNTRPIVSIPSDFRSYTIEFDLECLRRIAEAVGMPLPTHLTNERLSDPAVVHVAAQLVQQAYCEIDGCGRLSPQQRADQFLTGWLELMQQASGDAQMIDRSTLGQRRRAALDAANYIVGSPALSTPGGSQPTY